MKYISVPTAYAIYELSDEAFLMIGEGRLEQPPYLVLEVLAMNGAAKRLATIGMESFTPEAQDEDEEGEDGSGNDSPWPEDHE